MDDLPEACTVTNVEALARAHIRRFRLLIEQGREGNRRVRLDECARYEKLWRSVAKKAIDYPDCDHFTLMLTDGERAEIWDAVECGEYEDIVPLAREEGAG